MSINLLMRQLRFLLIATIMIVVKPSVVLGGDPVVADVSIMHAWEVTGFFDVLGQYDRAEADRSSFALNQTEVDLENQVSEHANVSIAVAYNSEEGVFQIGAAEMAFALSQRSATSTLGLSLAVGQFDVPFGIDYKYYASPDRKLISTPWFVDTHGYGWRGWNDFGVRLDGEYKNISMSSYWVNGFQSSAIVTDRITDLATGLSSEVEREVNTSPADAFGSRISLTILSTFELGTSFAVGLNKASQTEMLLSGFDAEWILKSFSFRGEYTHHSVNRSIAEESHLGYYIQSTYTYRKTSGTVRVSSFKPDGQPWASLISLGIGRALNEDVEVRLVSSLRSNTDKDKLVAQLVTSF